VATGYMLLAVGKARLFAKPPDGAEHTPSPGILTIRLFTWPRFSGILTESRAFSML